MTPPHTPPRRRTLPAAPAPSRFFCRPERARMKWNQPGSEWRRINSSEAGTNDAGTCCWWSGLLCDARPVPTLHSSSSVTEMQLLKCLSMKHLGAGWGGAGTWCSRAVHRSAAALPTPRKKTGERRWGCVRVRAPVCMFGGHSSFSLLTCNHGPHVAWY